MVKKVVFNASRHTVFSVARPHGSIVEIPEEIQLSLSRKVFTGSTDYEGSYRSSIRNSIATMEKKSLIFVAMSNFIEVAMPGLGRSARQSFGIVECMMIVEKQAPPLQQEAHLQ
jgi:hypothetical protein